METDGLYMLKFHYNDQYFVHQREWMESGSCSYKVGEAELYECAGESDL